MTKNDRLCFRFADQADMLDLLAWRNDPITRQYAFCQGKVSLQDHRRWFKRSWADPNRNIYIILDPRHNKLGQIRFDRQGKRAAIDIALAPAARGQGWGTRALRQGSEMYLNNVPVNYLEAKIVDENLASLGAFRKAGYKEFKRARGYQILRFYREKSRGRK